MRIVMRKVVQQIESGAVLHVSVVAYTRCSVTNCGSNSELGLAMILSADVSCVISLLKEGLALGERADRDEFWSKRLRLVHNLVFQKALYVYGKHASLF